MPDFTVIENRPKIHLVALIGAKVDADILPYWVRHYKTLELDSYTVFLHESGMPSMDNALQRMLLLDGFRVTMVPENALRDNPIMPNCPDMVRSILFESFALGLPQNDYLITADGDEFQQWGVLPREAVARGVRVMLGRLTDCFDDYLHPVKPEMSLEENYPIRHENLVAQFCKEYRLNQNKICMAPVGFPVDYSGSHDVKRGHVDVTPRMLTSGPLEVLHYRWRGSALTRSQGRRYWTEEDLQAMRQFFAQAPEEKVSQ